MSLLDVRVGQRSRGREALCADRRYRRAKPRRRERGETRCAQLGVAARRPPPPAAPCTPPRRILAGRPRGAPGARRRRRADSPAGVIVQRPVERAGEDAAPEAAARAAADHRRRRRSRVPDAAQRVLAVGEREGDALEHGAAEIGAASVSCVRPKKTPVRVRDRCAACARRTGRAGRSARGSRSACFDLGEQRGLARGAGQPRRPRSGSSRR